MVGSVLFDNLIVGYLDRGVDWYFNGLLGLADGCAVAPDEGCAKPFPVRVEPDGSVLLGHG